MAGRCSERVAVALGALLAAVVAAGASEPAATERADRLQAMRGEIERLQQELGRIEERERGVLGELRRLDAELSLRSAEREEVALRLETVRAALESTTDRVAGLDRAQEQRRRYLGFRLRELYKEGPERALRRLVGDSDGDAYWHALRYAAALNERDARTIDAFRADAENLDRHRERLERAYADLRGIESEVGEAERRLRDSRRARESTLRTLQLDATRRAAALGELREVAEELTRVVDSVRGAEGGPALDVRKFRGLLDWPVDGPVREGFGSIVHPRFKTRVPHPGLELGGAVGDPIRAVFEGEVAFAAWMRGYGLTAIVDHGGGLLSIYARAAVLLVEPGQRVVRGQKLGLLGAEGAAGQGLYFELRVDGKPADPTEWLRPR